MSMSRIDVKSPMLIVNSTLASTGVRLVNGAERVRIYTRIIQFSASALIGRAQGAGGEALGARMRSGTMHRSTGLGRLQLRAHHPGKQP